MLKNVYVYRVAFLQKDRLTHLRREAAREEFENMNMVNKNKILFNNTLSPKEWSALLDSSILLMNNVCLIKRTVNPQ